MWNGTKQFMNMYGTGIETQDRDQPGSVPLTSTSGGSTNPNDVAQEYYRVYNTASEVGIQKDVHWVKLKDVTLAYTMNVKKAKSAIKSYQVYAKGKDLWMWTNYIGGLDPDIASASSYRTYGIDFFGNPLTRAVIVGFKLTF